MRTVFKAVAEPLGTRTAYWNEVVGDRLAGLDIRLDDVPDARDELVVRDVGPLQMRGLAIPAPVGRRGGQAHRHAPSGAGGSLIPEQFSDLASAILASHSRPEVTYRDGVM
jgi:hypothetical protein